MTGFHLDLTLLSRNKSLLTKTVKLGHARHGEEKISLDKLTRLISVHASLSRRGQSRQ